MMDDIVSGNVFLAMAEHEAVGTVTIKNVEICRLFVLPRHQGKGYGKALMAYAEREIFLKSAIIRLDASLPAKGMYLKNGYKVLENHIMPTDNGDYLCYDVMEKSSGGESC
jgi:GNAT superfamily N-acetyltransferase